MRQLALRGRSWSWAVTNVAPQADERAELARCLLNVGVPPDGGMSFRCVAALAFRFVVEIDARANSVWQLEVSERVVAGQSVGRSGSGRLGSVGR